MPRHTSYADAARRLLLLDATLNGGEGLETLRLIARWLAAGDLEGARAEHARDGDKLAAYPAARDAVEAAIGCRSHGAVNCGSAVCRRVREMRRVG